MVNPSVVDLFAGAGGFGLGFEFAGFDLICSLEKDQWASDTLKANSTHNQTIIHDDIRKFESKKQVFSLLQTKPDVIIGGPPCQGFSLAGPVKNPNDPRNSLFKNFVSWVDFLEPSFFVMENVKGLLFRNDSFGNPVINIIQEAFSNIGYNSEVWILNAAEYGVPQLRERVFIVGNTQGLTLGPPEITHFIKNSTEKLKITDQKLKPAVTVSDAILDLPALPFLEGFEEQSYTDTPSTDFQKWARLNQNILYNHVAMKHTKRLVERYKIIQNTGSIELVPNEFQVRKRNGSGELSEARYSSNYRHLKGDRPSFTIPASFYSSFIHPNQPRNITAREAARIQSFPDNYKFQGKRTLISNKLLQQRNSEEIIALSQYNQIGNAVPPLLSKAIAEHIKLFL